MIKALGASATMISADRTTVTFKPDAGLESIKHPFWKPTKHDGTRLYVYGPDLSSLKTGQYSLKAYVACGTDINDLSCLADPTNPEGLSLAPAAAENCPGTTTPVAPVTTTPQTPLTTTPPPPPTTTPPTPSPTPDTPPTTTTTTTTTTTHADTFPTTTPPPQCNYIGTHNGGANPNWWQSGSNYHYQAYMSIPISSPITGGWYVDLTFQNPVQSMQYWSGQAEKMDNQGYQWRLIGWCNQRWENSIDLTYIGMTNTSGINNLARFSIIRSHV